MTVEKEIDAIVDALEEQAAVISSLITVAEALYATHPNPRDLLLDLHARSEKDSARELGTAISDAFVGRGEQTRLAFLSILRERLRDQRP